LLLALGGSSIGSAVLGAFGSSGLGSSGLGSNSLGGLFCRSSGLELGFAFWSSGFEFDRHSNGECLHEVV